MNKFDIIVVGGGHSGIESLLAAYNLGAKALLITMSFNTVGKMSCNPSIGGIGKGQIVREIDALGGYMGILADLSMIQFKMLNKSKGPAMWSPRAQIDRTLYMRNAQKLIIKKKIKFIEDIVTKLIIKNNKVKGVITKSKKKIKAKAVILTNGTFLNGKIFIGNKIYSGGRIKENSSLGLTEQLKKYGLVVGRMKTGTSPRISKKTINYDKLLVDKGENPKTKFSFRITSKIKKPQNCYITYTNKKTHSIVKKNISQSPIFIGIINNNGPRYCPSIEDKVYRFKNKNKHQIFIEPDGIKSNVVYLNGLSTSLPPKNQKEIVRSIKGLENAKILEYGYAVEYDYFNPIQLKITLESKKIDNLYMAGQINGTTGYEEAACQGLIAGINSYLKINKKAPFILKRNESYIGVLIDDLINKGTNEPYRMFTSRAEYRMLLRQDNSDIRLMPKAYKIGLLKKKHIIRLREKNNKIKKIIEFFKNKKINLNNILNIKDKVKTSSIYKILLRPEVTIDKIISYIKENLVDEFISKNLKYINKYGNIISNEIKYDYYIKKEKKDVERMNKLENLVIPNNFDYKKIMSLSNEGREKLIYYKPYSIGQATRISGVSASDINILIIYMK